MPIDSSTGYIPLDGSSQPGFWVGRTSLEKRLLFISLVLGGIVFALSIAYAFKTCEGGSGNSTTVSPPTTINPTTIPTTIVPPTEIPPTKIPTTIVTPTEIPPTEKPTTVIPTSKSTPTESSTTVISTSKSLPTEKTPVPTNYTIKPTATSPNTTLS